MLGLAEQAFALAVHEPQPAIAIISTSNGVNLADGLDGLSGGTLVFAWLSYMVVALLNAGASAVNVNIVSGDQSLFTRDISIGGNAYTEAIGTVYEYNYFAPPISGSNGDNGRNKSEATGGAQAESADTKGPAPTTPMVLIPRKVARTPTAFSNRAFENVDSLCFTRASQ